MRILFASKENSGASLCQKLIKEGHDLKLYTFDKNIFTQKALDGMVKKINDLSKGIRWVGKKGLIVFDDTGQGKLQDDLRKKGYSVVGGCELGDKLESDRQYGQKIFSAAGMKVAPSISFNSVSKIIKFLKRSPGPWALKQNGHSNKTLNYIGEFKDNRDLISLLEKYKHSYFVKNDCALFDLQKKIYGVELAVARFFNGNDWVGPIDLNIEHKNLCNLDLGPKTFEMGNLMWYTNDKNNRLFKETLDKLKPYLQKINFRGIIDIDCIVNNVGAFPLEASARFGYPAIHAKMEIHSSPWAEFLKAIADGNNFSLSWKKGFAIAILLAAPPFPFYRPGFNSFSPEGITIHFRKNLSDAEMNSVHFEEVAKKKSGEYHICDHTGYVLHVSSIGKSVKETRKKVYALAEKIIIPKKYYRTDIGLKFVEEDREKLRKWGWI